MQYAIDYIRHFFPGISDKAIKTVLSNTKERSFKKGEVMINKGEIPSYFYIIRSGVARGYILDKNGKEYIKTLYFPPSTAGPLSALIQQRETETIYDCITDCEVVEFDYNRFKEQADKSLELSTLNIKVLEAIFIRSNDRINDLSILDATERYLKLKKKIPNIENLVAQYHIASYLNITPVQLSRIRKKLFSQ